MMIIVIIPIIIQIIIITPITVVINDYRSSHSH